MTQPKDIAVVIGDVHGCYTKLCDVLEPLYNSGKQLIFLGDLIDRAPETEGDINVVRLVRRLEETPEEFGFSKVTVLRGNHEEMLISLVMNPTPERCQHWLDNGGSHEFYQAAAKEGHLQWIDSLRMKHVVGKYLFVHAGVKPGVELKKQRKQDLLWIRKPFLEAEDHGLPYFIYHGHTVTESFEPEFYAKRAALDTGACFGGELTAIEVDLTADPFAVEQSIPELVAA